MTVEYQRATKAAKIGQSLVNKHHKGLSGIRIEYLFRDKASKSGGRDVWGKTTKVSGLYAYLAGESSELDAAPGESFFVIVLAKDVWEILDESAREALVDHQLSYCSAEFNDEGDVALKVKTADLTEFSGVVSRHGMWREDVEKFLKAAADSGQLAFGDDEPKDDE